MSACQPLTARQSELLTFLKRCDTSPSFEEMAQHLGIASKSGIHRLLTSLQERGFIRRRVGAKRAIELVQPDPLRTVLTVDLIAELQRRGLNVSGPLHAERNAA